MLDRTNSMDSQGNQIPLRSNSNPYRLTVERYNPLHESYSPNERPSGSQENDYELPNNSGFPPCPKIPAPLIPETIF